MIGKLKAIMITMDCAGNIVDYDVLSIKIPLLTSRKKVMQFILKNPSRMKASLELNALKENVLLYDFETWHGKDNNVLVITYKLRDLRTLGVGKGLLILG